MERMIKGKYSGTRNSIALYLLYEEKKICYR